MSRDGTIVRQLESNTVHDLSSWTSWQLLCVCQVIQYDGHPIWV